MLNFHDNKVVKLEITFFVLYITSHSAFLVLSYIYTFILQTDDIVVKTISIHCEND